MNNLVFAAAAAAFIVAGGPAPARATSYTFQDIINPDDPTFNQELGINNSGEIAGYFGSGMAGFPNKGYTTSPPYTSFTGENFPGSVQTQVIGINDVGTTVGFWSNTNLGVGADSNFGFVDHGGVFTNVNNPNTPPLAPVFLNQLLGVNNSNIAVGFYVDAGGGTHGYTYNITTNTFSANIDDPLGIGTTTAAAINNSGEIGGFYTNGANETLGFIDDGGTFTTISVPGATEVMVLGLNDNGYAAGTYTNAAGGMFGFLYDLNNGTYQTISDPFGIGLTTIKGVNDRNQLVGFYTNGAGDTIGLLATPTPVPEPSSLLLLVSGFAGIGLAGYRASRRGAVVA